MKRGTDEPPGSGSKSKRGRATCDPNEAASGSQDGREQEQARPVENEQVQAEENEQSQPAEDTNQAEDTPTGAGTSEGHGAQPQEELQDDMNMEETNPPASRSPRRSPEPAAAPAARARRSVEDRLQEYMENARRERLRVPETLTQEQLDDRRHDKAAATLEDHCKEGKIEVYGNQEWDYEPERADKNPVPQLSTSVAIAKRPRQRSEPLSRKDFYDALLTVNHQPPGSDLFKKETHCQYTFIVAAHMYRFYDKYAERCHSVADVWAWHMLLCQYYLQEVERDQAMLERLSKRVEETQQMTVSQAMTSSSTATYAQPNRPNVILDISQDDKDSLSKFQENLRDDNMSTWTWEQINNLFAIKLGFASTEIKALLKGSPMQWTRPPHEGALAEMSTKKLQAARNRLKNDLVKEETYTDERAHVTVPPHAKRTSMEILWQILHSNELEAVLREQNPLYRLAFTNEQVQPLPEDTNEYTAKQRNGMTFAALPVAQSRITYEHSGEMRARWMQYAGGIIDENRVKECTLEARRAKEWKQINAGIEYLDSSRPILFSAFNTDEVEEQLQELIYNAQEFTREHTPQLFAGVLLPAMPEPVIRLMHLKICQHIYTLMFYAEKCGQQNKIQHYYRGLYKQRGLLLQICEVLEYFLEAEHTETAVNWVFTEQISRMDRLRSEAYERTTDASSAAPGLARGQELELSPPVTDLQQNEEIRQAMKYRNARPKQSHNCHPVWDRPHVPLASFLIQGERDTLPVWMTVFSLKSPFPLQDTTDLMSILAHLQRWKWKAGLPPNQQRELEMLLGHKNKNRNVEWVLKYSNMWGTNDVKARENAKTMQRLAGAAGRLQINQPLTQQVQTDMVRDFMADCQLPINFVPEVNLACHSLQMQPVSNDQYLLEQAITDIPGVLRPHTANNATILSQAVPQATCDLNPEAPVPILMRVELNHEAWTQEEYIESRQPPILKAPLGQEQASSLYSSRAKGDCPNELTPDEWQLFCSNLEQQMTPDPVTTQHRLNEDRVKRLYTTPVARNKMCLLNAIHNMSMVGARALTQPLNYTRAQSREEVDEICEELKQEFRRNNSIALTLHTAPCSAQLHTMIKDARDKLYMAKDFKSPERAIKQYLAQYLGYVPLPLTAAEPKEKDYRSFITMFVFACSNGASYIIPARYAVLEGSSYRLTDSVKKLLTKLETTVGRRGPRWIMYQPEQSIDLFQKTFDERFTSHYIDHSKCYKAYGFEKEPNLHDLTMLLLRVRIEPECTRQYTNGADQGPEAANEVYEARLEDNMAVRMTIRDVAQVHTTSAAPVLNCPLTNLESDKADWGMDWIPPEYDIKGEPARQKLTLIVTRTQAIGDTFMIGAAVNPEFESQQMHYHSLAIKQAEHQVVMGFAAETTVKRNEARTQMNQLWDDEQRTPVDVAPGGQFAMIYAVYMYLYRHCNEALNMATYGQRPTQRHTKLKDQRESGARRTLDLAHEIANQQLNQQIVAQSRVTEYELREHRTYDKLKTQLEVRQKQRTKDTKAPHGAEHVAYMIEQLGPVQAQKMMDAAANYEKHAFLHQTPRRYPVNEAEHAQLLRREEREPIVRTACEQTEITEQDVQIISRQAANNATRVILTMLSYVSNRQEQKPTLSSVATARVMATLNRQFMRTMIILHSNPQLDPLARWRIETEGNYDCALDRERLLSNYRTLLQSTSPMCAPIPKQFVFIGHETLLARNKKEQNYITVEYSPCPDTTTVVYHKVAERLKQNNRAQMSWTKPKQLPSRAVNEQQQEDHSDSLLLFERNRKDFLKIDLNMPPPTLEYTKWWEDPTFSVTAIETSKQWYKLSHTEHIRKWIAFIIDHTNRVSDERLQRTRNRVKPPKGEPPEPVPKQPTPDQVRFLTRSLRAQGRNNYGLINPNNQPKCTLVDVNAGERADCHELVRIERAVPDKDRAELSQEVQQALLDEFEVTRTQRLRAVNLAILTDTRHIRIAIRKGQPCHTQTDLREDNPNLEEERLLARENDDDPTGELAADRQNRITEWEEITKGLNEHTHSAVVDMQQRYKKLQMLPAANWRDWTVTSHNLLDTGRTVGQTVALAREQLNATQDDYNIPVSSALAARILTDQNGVLTWPVGVQMMTGFLQTAYRELDIEPIRLRDQTALVDQTTQTMTSLTGANPPGQTGYHKEVQMAPRGQAMARWKQRSEADPRHETAVFEGPVKTHDAPNYTQWDKLSKFTSEYTEGQQTLAATFGQQQQDVWDATIQQEDGQSQQRKQIVSYDAQLINDCEPAPTVARATNVAFHKYSWEPWDAWYRQAERDGVRTEPVPLPQLGMPVSYIMETLFQAYGLEPGIEAVQARLMECYGRHYAVVSYRGVDVGLDLQPGNYPHLIIMPYSYVPTKLIGKKASSHAVFQRPLLGTMKLWNLETIPVFENEVNPEVYKKRFMNLVLMAICEDEGLCYKCYHQLPEEAMPPGLLRDHPGCTTPGVAPLGREPTELVHIMRNQTQFPGYQERVQMDKHTAKYHGKWAAPVRISNPEQGIAARYKIQSIGRVPVAQGRRRRERGHNRRGPHTPPYPPPIGNQSNSLHDDLLITDHNHSNNNNNLNMERPGALLDDSLNDESALDYEDDTAQNNNGGADQADLDEAAVLSQQLRDASLNKSSGEDSEDDSNKENGQEGDTDAGGEPTAADQDKAEDKQVQDQDKADNRQEGETDAGGEQEPVEQGKHTGKLAGKKRKFRIPSPKPKQAQVQAMDTDNDTGTKQPPQHKLPKRRKNNKQRPVSTHRNDSRRSQRSRLSTSRSSLASSRISNGTFGYRLGERIHNNEEAYLTHRRNLLTVVTDVEARQLQRTQDHLQRVNDELTYGEVRLPEDIPNMAGRGVPLQIARMLQIKPLDPQRLTIAEYYMIMYNSRWCYYCFELGHWTVDCVMPRDCRRVRDPPFRYLYQLGCPGLPEQWIDSNYQLEVAIKRGTDEDVREIRERQHTHLMEIAMRKAERSDKALAKSKQPRKTVDIGDDLLTEHNQEATQRDIALFKLSRKREPSIVLSDGEEEELMKRPSGNTSDDDYEDESTSNRNKQPLPDME